MVVVIVLDWLDAVNWENQLNLIVNYLESQKGFEYPVVIALTKADEIKNCIKRNVFTDNEADGFVQFVRLTALKFGAAVMSTSHSRIDEFLEYTRTFSNFEPNIHDKEMLFIPRLWDSEDKIPKLKLKKQKQKELKFEKSQQFYARLHLKIPLEKTTTKTTSTPIETKEMHDFFQSLLK